MSGAPTSLWLEVGGRRAHALASARAGGTRRGDPVVLVHGLAVSSRYMAPAIRELAGDADVYAPDLPGFGRSEGPARALDIPELAAALAAWMDAAGLGRAALVGHSLGCQVVAEFALRHPERVAGVVLAAPTGDPLRRGIVRQLLRLMLDATREPPSLIPLVVLDYLTAGFVRATRTLRLSLRDRFAEKLPRIEAPALVLHGGRDPLVSRRWSEEAAALLPRGRLLTIDGAAHAMNYNSPARFARAIENFLR